MAWKVTTQQIISTDEANLNGNHGLGTYFDHRQNQIDRNPLWVWLFYMLICKSIPFCEFQLYVPMLWMSVDQVVLSCSHGSEQIRWSVGITFKHDGQLI